MELLLEETAEGYDIVVRCEHGHRVGIGLARNGPAGRAETQAAEQLSGFIARLAAEMNEHVASDTHTKDGL